jgi:hypothetical protein
MKTIILFLCILFSSSVFAQKTDSVAYLSNLKGKGLCIRQGIQSNLKIPFFFINGDKVKILSGNAIIVLNTEEEVKIGSGETFTVATKMNLKANENDLLIYKYTKQSTSSFNMRSVGGSKVQVFPKKSKIIDPINARIRISNLSNKKYSFRLVNNDKKEIVYKLQELKDSLIEINPSLLDKGNQYTWFVKFPEREISGDFVVLSDIQTKDFPIFLFINRASYTMAFNYYCQKECFFEACSVIDEAIKTYPDDEYYKYLKNSLIGE